MDEGARDGDHMRVWLPSMPHFRHTDLTGDHAILQTHSDAEFKHSIRQRYVALATDDDTGSASSAHVFTLRISLLNFKRPAWHLPITSSWPPQLGQRRGDSGDGCQRDDAERRWG